MTFVELQDEVLDRIGNSEPRARARIKRALNEWHQRICAEAGLDYAFGDAKTTLNLIAGTSEYAVPAGLIKVRAIHDGTTLLRETSLHQILDADPAGTSRGTPTHYALRGYRTLKFHPVPSANATVNLDGQAYPLQMTNDTDTPLLPVQFHYLLALGARANEYEKVDDSRRFLLARKDLEEGILKLKHYLVTRAVSERAAPQTSTLGPWFPAGS